MVLYFDYITAAANSISSQLGTSCQGSRYGIVKAGGTARPSRTKSHLQGHSPHPVSQAGRRIGPALLPSASLVTKEKKGILMIFLAVIKRSCNSWRLPSLITWPLFFHFPKYNFFRSFFISQGEMLPFKT
jgi:hypothetical protein